MNITGSIAIVLSIGLLSLTISSSGQTAGVQFINITNLHTGDNVSWQQSIEGDSSAVANSGLNVYLLIWPIEAYGPWWVQQTQTFPDGTWQSNANFGRNPKMFPEDIGTTYKVEAVMTNEVLKPGMTLAELPSVPKSDRSEIITVKRI